MANKGEFKAVPAEENESAVEISAVKAKSADISADAAATTPPPATVASTATDTKAAEDKDKDKNEEKEKEKEKDELKNAKAMSFYELMVVLKPFFWPSAGSDGALLNRIRAASTWGAVMISKACSLAAPLFLLDATNELVAGDWDSAKVRVGVCHIPRNCPFFVFYGVFSSHPPSLPPSLHLPCPWLHRTTLSASWA